jgi:hypothetical protein
VHVKKGVDVASRTDIPNDALKCRLDDVADGLVIIVHESILYACGTGKCFVRMSSW